MTDTFSFNWNTVANLIMAIGTIGLFFVAVRRNQKSDVRLVTDPVSREHCKEVHDREDQRLHALEKQIAEFKSERHSDVGQLHEKINTVDRRLARIESASELQAQSLAAVTTDIKIILSEMPRI